MIVTFEGVRGGMSLAVITFAYQEFCREKGLGILVSHSMGSRYVFFDQACFLRSLEDKESREDRNDS